MSPKFQLTLLKLWHAFFAGSYLVAYLTADEDTYFMHEFAGYAVLTAVVLRLAIGLSVSAGPLRLHRPSVRAFLDWLPSRKGRHPLFIWFSAALLVVIGVAAVSGVLADGLTWLEGPHEAAAEASLWVIFAHIAFVSFMYGGKRLIKRLAVRLSAVRPFADPSKEMSR